MQDGNTLTLALHIQSLTKADYGQYKCVSENKLGKDSDTMTLYGGSPSSPSLSLSDRLVGLVVKASSSRAEDLGFESRLRRDIFMVESYQ